MVARIVPWWGWGMVPMSNGSFHQRGPVVLFRNPKCFQCAARPCDYQGAFFKRQRRHPRESFRPSYVGGWLL